MSVYCKDELPTWEEIHNFLKAGRYDYEPYRDDEVTDPYWKRPRQKIMLAWICNQLNKLCIDNKLLYTQFNLVGLERDDIPVSAIPFTVYTCKIPSTNKWSIYITNDRLRTDIDSLNSCRLQLIVNTLVQSDDVMKTTINQLFDDVITYYKDPIGWKNT